MGESFDNYLVWNEFFKNYLTEINTDYKRKNIVICGHPRIKITEGHKNLKPDNIIFLEETNFNFEEALPYMQLVSDRFNIIYRKKPGLRSKDYFFNSLDLSISDKTTLEEDLEKYKPFLLVGFESTALLESLLFDIPSLSLAGSRESVSVILNKSLVDVCFDLKSFEEKVEFYNQASKYDIKNLKEQLWGKIIESSYDDALNKLDLK